MAVDTSGLKRFVGGAARRRAEQEENANEPKTMILAAIARMMGMDESMFGGKEEKAPTEGDGESTSLNRIKKKMLGRATSVLTGGSQQGEATKRLTGE